MKDQEKAQIAIGITKYVNRHLNKKLKNEVRLEILKEKLLIKEKKSETQQWIQQDSIPVYTIDKIQQLEKPSEQYTLLRIIQNTVPQEKRNDDCITFRILNIALSKKVVGLLRKKMEQLKNLPNYITIQQKQALVMKSILLSEKQYMMIFKKAVEQKLTGSNTLREVLDFQRILLSDHPEMNKFNLLKHQLKYEQQKNILIEKLKMNKSEQEEIVSKKKSIFDKNLSNNYFQTNFNRMQLQKSVQKGKQDGRIIIQGYSSKRQFEGLNLGGDEEFFMKQSAYNNMGSDSSQMRKQNLVLQNIKLSSNEQNEDLFDDRYHDYTFQIKRSTSKLKGNQNENEKMQIEEGEVIEKNQLNSYKKTCKKMQISEGKQVKLQQKKQEKVDKKGENNQNDLGSNSQGQLSITKLAVIWCKLFYNMMKQGGIQHREKELTCIENELKRLSNTQTQEKISKEVTKMIERISTNYLKVKRGQTVY